VVSGAWLVPGQAAMGASLHPAAAFRCSVNIEAASTANTWTEQAQRSVCLLSSHWVKCQIILPVAIITSDCCALWPLCLACMLLLSALGWQQNICVVVTWQGLSLQSVLIKTSPAEIKLAAQSLCLASGLMQPGTPQHKVLAWQPATLGALAAMTGWDNNYQCHLNPLVAPNYSTAQPLDLILEVQVTCEHITTFGATKVALPAWGTTK